jgi:hypothetical protein
VEYSVRKRGPDSFPASRTEKWKKRPDPLFFRLAFGVSEGYRREEKGLRAMEDVPMRTGRRDAGDSLVWVILLVLILAGLWFVLRPAPAKPGAPGTQGSTAGATSPAPAPPRKASTAERIARDVDDFADYATGGIAIETGKRMKSRIRGLQRQQRQRGVPEKEPDAEKK